MAVTLQSQQTQNICIPFVQRRPNVLDVGPTLYKCYTNVLCLLRCKLVYMIVFAGGGGGGGFSVGLCRYLPLIFDRIMIQPAIVWRLWSQPHTPNQCNSKRTRIVHPVVDQRCRLWPTIIPSTGLPSLFAIYIYYSACCTAYVIVTLEALKSEIKIFTHLKLCLATAIHNFKRVKIAYICIILIKMYANSQFCKLNAYKFF